jgi:acetyl/propionyl-CoA carboxylase alpha subunit
MLPASPPLAADPTTWGDAARQVGYPLLVKPAATGGGRGLRRVVDESVLIDAVAASLRESVASGAGELAYLERELPDPRHIEVQVASDGQLVLALGDRDCSLQRRHQKVIEEAPAPNLDDATRHALHDHARRIAVAVDLRGIATCEFLLGGDGTLAFLEVNPRLQVEHPVTELVTRLDLVEWQLRLAAGESLPLPEAPNPRGHAVEARVYAEDPAADFFPTPGRLTAVDWPRRPDLRVDAGYGSGDDVPAAYDPLLAKLVAHGSDRAAALATLRDALVNTVIAGLPTNLPWLLALLETEAVRTGRATTRTALTVAMRPPDRTTALLAAIAHTLDRSTATTADPWSAIGPWRLTGETTLMFHGEDWAARVVVRRAAIGWEVDIDGVTIALRWWRDPAGVWTIAGADTIARVAIVEGDGALEVAGAGGRWLLRAGPKATTTSTRRGQTHDGQVRAPLPARVLHIHATVGKPVARGEPLVTLMAMKMELVCAAPVAGVVTAIACRSDQVVATDDLLVELAINDHARSPVLPGAT